MSPAPVPLNQAPTSGPSIAAPHHGHGVMSVSCSTTMAAPPLRCLEAVLDTADYPKWNTFCPRAIIDDAPPPAAEPDDAGSVEPELGEIAKRPHFLHHGVKFQFEVLMEQGKPTNRTALQVSVLEKFQRDGRTGYRVAWTMRGMPYYVLHAERVQEFVQTPDGRGTEYYCFETFGGVMAYLMRRMVGSKLEDGFGRWMNSLKEWVENWDNNPQ